MSDPLILDFCILALSQEEAVLISVISVQSFILSFSNGEWYEMEIIILSENIYLAY